MSVGSELVPSIGARPRTRANVSVNRLTSEKQTCVHCPFFFKKKINSVQRSYEKERKTYDSSQYNALKQERKSTHGSLVRPVCWPVCKPCGLFAADFLRLNAVVTTVLGKTHNNPSLTENCTRIDFPLHTKTSHFQ